MNAHQPLLPILAAQDDPGPARLLLVDDQRVIIQSLNQIFSHEYEVLFATSGQQALDLCESSRPDLILLDVAMPQMDGPALCRLLKQQAETRDIPIIFVTASDHPSQEDACWEAGGVDFITKPVNANTVRHRVRAHLTLKRQADLLRRMVFIDGLTGVANRRYFDERLQAEWRRCLRSGRPLSLAMIDVDFFKHYNDRNGHQAGDDCLQRVAATIQSCLRRPHDLAARYGGEEFCCLLPETDLAAARRIGSQIESAVRALALAHGDSRAADVVTVSVGVASAVPTTETQLTDLLAAADQGLYAAKAAGRGRVHG